MKAWHFVAADKKLRDGRPLPEPGVILRHEGPIELCSSGLHASIRPIDALRYAPGPYICRVDCTGHWIRSDDKIVCTERTILWGYDATAVLRKFARMCALDVIEKWNAPEVVVKYLKTGDEELRATAADASAYAYAAAARAAARDAALAAAGDAALDAQNRRLYRMLMAGREG